MGNIAPAYQTYALQTDDGVKEYKTKTYMIGNLDAHKDKTHKNGMKKTKQHKQETENDSYDDDEDIDDGNVSNALGGGDKLKFDQKARRKTPDSMTNLIGNDSNEKLDMSPIELRIHNAE